MLVSVYQMCLNEEGLNSSLWLWHGWNSSVVAEWKALVEFPLV